MRIHTIQNPSIYREEMNNLTTEEFQNFCKSQQEKGVKLTFVANKLGISYSLLQKLRSGARPVSAKVATAVENY